MSPEQERPGRGSARTAILVATIELIAEEGLDAVTHRRVAERARVSPGSTTHHFATRQDLIRDAFRLYVRQADRLIITIGDAVRASSVEPLARVRRVLGEVVRQEFADDRLIRAEYEMLLFASTDEVLAADVRRWESHWIAYLAADLEEAGWPRAIEGARTLMNLMRGYELERLLNPALGAEDFQRRLDIVLR